MPAAPRKSTGNARNKKHIPYRHDDLQHGKRTGMAVDVVDRNSDDFEPFDKLLSQADTRTPPRVRGNKRKSIVPSPMYEDEDGEMSMDMASPISYFSSQRVRVPETLIHTGPSARTSYFSPEVDFDEVPSPRASVAAISASRRRSSGRLNGKSPGSGLGRSRLSQSHLGATPKTATARTSRGEVSPGLPGDSDEDLDDGFEPPPTFEYRSNNRQLSPSPDRASFRDLSREEDEPPAAPDPDPTTPAGDRRQKTLGRSTRKSKSDDKPLFLPGSDDEKPEASTSKQPNRRKSSKANIALQQGEEEGVEEDPPEDMEMDLDPPVEEDFDSRRSKKLSSIMEAPELEEEEEEEPEPMDFEQDARPDEPPEDQPDEPPEEAPPSIPPKKRGRKKISFDENTIESQRPSRKPRSNRTPLADKTSDSRYVSIRPGEPRSRLRPLGLSSEQTLLVSITRSHCVSRKPTGATEGSQVSVCALGLVASGKGRLRRRL
jgi:centromere protein C